MNITQGFIRRPVMTTLVMMGIVLFGVAGYRALPVSDLPNVDFPTIRVGAGLPGAGPETMAASVATPLERQFATIPGVDSITEARRPLGVAVVGGLVVSQILTLYITPVVYVYMERLRGFTKKTKPQKKISPAQTEATRDLAHV